MAIGPGSAKAFAAFWAEYGLPFMGVPDPGGVILQQLQQTVSWLRLGRMPGVYIVDMNARIRWLHHGNSMWDIPTTDSILNILAQIRLEAEPPAVP